MSVPLPSLPSMCRVSCVLSTLCSRSAMHAVCSSREDYDGPRTVKLLAVSSLGRIVVYSELQSLDDKSVGRYILYGCTMNMVCSHQHITNVLLTLHAVVDTVD